MPRKIMVEVRVECHSRSSKSMFEEACEAIEWATIELSKKISHRAVVLEVVS